MTNQKIEKEKRKKWCLVLIQNLYRLSCKRRCVFVWHVWHDGSISGSRYLHVLYIKLQSERGCRRRSGATCVISRPSATADIDHIIPAEVIINVTGSCNKEREAALFQSPTLSVRSGGPFLGGGGLTPFQQCRPSLPKMNVFYSCLPNYPECEPMSLATMFFPKGCVSEGLSMIL